ncbi:MAG: putative peptidase membrane zinc metallopeptidase [Bacillota bacterium]|nr:MAG: putative peptidase membrane zinc metallopeptidase [Bacillota bacterium]MBS3951001.1 zinc metallopeptidase [Peptococcaceae bacterium]
MLFGGPGFALILVAMLFASFAQIKIRSAYQKYSMMRVLSGRTGADVAKDILRRGGLDGVEVEPIQGVLSDHYDPRARKVRLSSEVFNGSSVAALGIAAHETGHALQHHEQYFPLALRSSILPVASFGSNLAFPLFFAGLFFNNPLFMDVGIFLFAGAVLFQIVTLPVEFNASQRAVALLHTGGYVTREEEGPVRDMLRAAGYTYLAATAVSLAHFLRLVLLRGSRRR